MNSLKYLLLSQIVKLNFFLTFFSFLLLSYLRERERKEKGQ